LVRILLASGAIVPTQKEINMAGKQLRKKVSRSKSSTIAQPTPLGEFMQEGIDQQRPTTRRTRSIGGRMNREGRASTHRKAPSTRTRSAGKRPSKRPSTGRKSARTKGTTRRRVGAKKRGRARASRS
jgi:hypothetical protein